MATFPSTILTKRNQIRTKLPIRPESTTHLYRSTTLRGAWEVEQWYREVKPLAEGAYGKVYVQTCQIARSDAATVKPGHQRVVKEIPKRTTKRDSRDNVKTVEVRYYNELEATAIFCTEQYADHFVQSSGWYEDDDMIYVAMEYMEKGNLRSNIGRKSVPEKQAKAIMRQILEGVCYMHEINYTHRDFKPENILVKETAPEWWVKIADFGTNKHVFQGTPQNQTFVGTGCYMAPEMLADLRYTKAVDIWSIGIIAHYILTGRLPFENSARLQVYLDSNDRSFPLPLSLPLLQECSVSASGIAFVRALLTINPKHRPEAKDMLEHVWLPRRPQSTIVPGRHVPQEQSTAIPQYRDDIPAWSSLSSIRSDLQDALPPPSNSALSEPVLSQQHKSEQITTRTISQSRPEEFGEWSEISGQQPLAKAGWPSPASTASYQTRNNMNMEHELGPGQTVDPQSDLFVHDSRSFDSRHKSHQDSELWLKDTTHAKHKSVVESYSNAFRQGSTPRNGPLPYARNQPGIPYQHGQVYHIIVPEISAGHVETPPNQSQPNVIPGNRSYTQSASKHYPQSAPPNISVYPHHPNAEPSSPSDPWSAQQGTSDAIPSKKAQRQYWPAPNSASQVHNHHSHGFPPPAIPPPGSPHMTDGASSSSMPLHRSQMPEENPPNGASYPQDRHHEYFQGTRPDASGLPVSSSDWTHDVRNDSPRSFSSYYEPLRLDEEIEEKLKPALLDFQRGRRARAMQALDQLLDTSRSWPNHQSGCRLVLLEKTMCMLEKYNSAEARDAYIDQTLRLRQLKQVEDYLLDTLNVCLNLCKAQYLPVLPRSLLHLLHFCSKMDLTAMELMNWEEQQERATRILDKAIQGFEYYRDNTANTSDQEALNKALRKLKSHSKLLRDHFENNPRGATDLTDHALGMDDLVRPWNADDELTDMVGRRRPPYQGFAQARGRTLDVHRTYGEWGSERHAGYAEEDEAGYSQRRGFGASLKHIFHLDKNDRHL